MGQTSYVNASDASAKLLFTIDPNGVAPVEGGPAWMKTDQYDIDATADQLIDVLWAALTPPDLAVQALQRFRVEVAEANRRFEEAAVRLPGEPRHE